MITLTFTVSSLEAKRAEFSAAVKTSERRDDEAIHRQAQTNGVWTGRNGDIFKTLSSKLARVSGGPGMHQTNL